MLSGNLLTTLLAIEVANFFVSRRPSQLCLLERDQARNP